MDDNEWLKEKHQKDFDKWVKQGKTILLSRNKIKLNNYQKNDLKILSARIEVLLGKAL